MTFIKREVGFLGLPNAVHLTSQLTKTSVQLKTLINIVNLLDFCAIMKNKLKYGTLWSVFSTPTKLQVWLLLKWITFVHAQNFTYDMFNLPLNISSIKVISAFTGYSDCWCKEEIEVEYQFIQVHL